MLNTSLGLYNCRTPPPHLPTVSLHPQYPMKAPPFLSLSLLLFFLIVSPLANASSDLQPLLKLKASMLGQSGSGLDNWVVTTHPPSPSVHCSFSGITCDENFRVTSVNVTSVPLFGTISPEIGLLNKLVNLTLVANNLTGNLPLDMGNLSSVRYINLSVNTFSGEFPGKMVVGMTELEVFDAYNNNFTGKLPVEFSGLKKLRVLYLGGNYFSGEIPEAYSEFQSLQSLGLQGNTLTGAIPACLSRLPKIEELWLGYFNTYKGGIPPELGSISTLKLLDLGGSNLSGEIPASLGNLKMLHTLFLQYNQLTGTIPSELSGCDSLMSLDLSVNELHGYIPESFEKLKNLTLLNLFSNHFAGPIPAFIGDWPNLEALQIWKNNFTFELPENLGKNGRLLFLDVSLNHLTGTIPRYLCSGGRLKTLILMQNYFLGPIPDELGNCASLIRIRLGKNFFNGSIPGGFFNLPNLDMLELEDNYFSGELPTEMSSHSIESIILSNNWITGKIPPAIGNLVSLITVSLQNNIFFGEIPVEISNIKMLDKINISGNNVTGEIPSSIAKCTHLTLVDLSRNHLFGIIPREILGMPNINILNVSRNHLSGPIPSKLGHMIYLTVLDLSYNNFSGRVPMDGQLKDFNESFFIGNPDLCLPHRYCRIPIKPYHKSSRLSTSKLVVLVIVVIAVFLFGVITFLSLRNRKFEKSNTWKLTAFQRLDFKVEDVAECLRDENIIGKGGAGIVYRGSMPNGIDVAIKRLIGRSSGRSDHGFSAEIQTLARIRHRNIVRLLGYVSNKDNNLLLYEYMSNGSLGEILHGSKGAYLQWETRYRIAVEAAKGLCYLHHDCSPLIIHRDVKSDNILLDSDYEAHVADFGLAKFMQDAGASECMSSIAGSYGYIAPEYAYTLKVDKKSDVYSFGVVLLELVAGKKPVGEFGDGVDIVRWVRDMKTELPKPTDTASVLAVLDSRLTGYKLTSVVNLFKIAMLCVEDEATARPTMREVVHMLTNPPESPPPANILTDSLMNG